MEVSRKRRGSVVEVSCRGSVVEVSWKGCGSVVKVPWKYPVVEAPVPIKGAGEPQGDMKIPPPQDRAPARVSAIRPPRRERPRSARREPADEIV